MDADERKEGTVERVRVLKMVVDVKEQKLVENHMAAQYTRQKTEAAVREAKSMASLAKKRAAQANRHDSEMWREEKQQHDLEQRTRASVGKQAVDPPNALLSHG